MARRHVMQTLKEEYDRMSEKQMDTADPELDMEPQPLDRIVKVNGENGTNQRNPLTMHCRGSSPRYKSSDPVSKKLDLKTAECATDQAQSPETPIS